MILNASGDHINVPPGTRRERTALPLGSGALDKTTLGMPGEDHPSLSGFVFSFYFHADKLRLGDRNTHLKTF